MSGAARRTALVFVIATLVVSGVALNARAATALHAPTGVVVVRITTSSVRVSWLDTNAKSARYEVQESLDAPGSYKVVGTTRVGVTSYTRKSAPAGRARYYRVRAFVVVKRKKQYSDFSSVVALEAPDPTTSTSTSTSTFTTSSTSTSTSTTTTTIAPPPGASQFAIRSGSYDYARSIAVDASSGATYVAGTFSGTSNFGGSRTYTSSTAGDVFVAKYAADQTLQWVQIIASQQPSPNELGGIAIEPNGDVVAAGGFWGGVNIGSVALTSRGGRDTFVADLAATDGSVRWAHGYSATRWDTNNIDDEATTIATAADGTIAVGGTFAGTLTFGAAGAPSVTSSSLGDSFDGFVAGFDASGNARWARHFDDVSIDIVNDVAFDSVGNLFVVGRSWSTIDFGLGPLTPPAGSYNDMYLAKLGEADGATRWAKVFSGPQDDIATAVAVGADGDPVLVGTTYIAGSGGKGADFGQGPVTGLGGTNAVVAKFDTNGRNLWARNFGGAASLSASDVAVDAQGNIVTTGGFYGTLDVGGGALTSTTTHLLLFALSSSGTFAWQVRTSGDMSNGIAISFDRVANRVDTTGNFSGNVDFGAGTLTSMQAASGAYPTNIFVFTPGRR